MTEDGSDQDEAFWTDDHGGRWRKRAPHETGLRGRCPRCGEARGDLRHVINWCASEPLPTIRSSLWDAVEGLMQNAAGQEWWCSQVVGVYKEM